jgi:hypothetical protein
MSTTPKKITKRVRKFIATLGNVGDPVYLSFTHISDNYLAKHCLSNCEAEQYFSGVPVIYGWVIWEDEGEKFIEAEFHAVVKRGGRFIDITPRSDGESRVLFVPDKVRKAIRLSARKWNTWTNHKSYNGQLENTGVEILENSHDDRLF